MLERVWVIDREGLVKLPIFSKGFLHNVFYASRVSEMFLGSRVEDFSNVGCGESRINGGGERG